MIEGGVYTDTLVLVLDIVGFSRLLPVEAEAAAHTCEARLSEALSGVPHTRLPLGDGLALLVPASPGRAERLLAGARALCEGNAPEARGALHRGRFRFTPDGPIGTGVHLATFVAALAWPRQLLVTQRFVDTLERPPALVPAAGEDPLEVSFKPDKTTFVRVVAGEQLQTRLPHKVAVQQRAAAVLEREIQLLHGALEDFLADLGLDPELLSARVTLWRRRGDQLAQMYPRRCRNPAAERPSRVRWRTGEGPVGRCLTAERPVLLLDLPPPTDWITYSAAWERWGVGAARLEEFSRHARSILAIPVQLGGPPGFDAVLCIDLLPALSDLHPQLEGLADSIHQAQAPHLASLIALREL